MKKFLSFCALFVGVLGFSVNAHAWQVNANISVSRGVAVATVVNSYGRPIVCNGQAYGRVRSGAVVNSWMNSVLIYPGSYANVYVYSNYEPFVNAWANINCQWYY